MTVQRWNFADWSHVGDSASMDPEPDGKWVPYEDYQSLQAALREALDGWEDSERQHDYPGADELDRIAELRKFLDDK